MRSQRNPFEELEQMLDRMSRRFDETAGRWGDEEWGLFGGGDDVAVDLLDRDEEFVVTVDVPGFDRDEIDLSVAEQTLWIEGERAEASEEGSESYLRRERRRKSVRRSIRLPAPVKPDEVEATLRNGILTVTVPKAEPADDAKKIEIA